MYDIVEHGQVEIQLAKKVELNPKQVKQMLPQLKRIFNTD
jgi:hypothetical protein